METLLADVCFEVKCQKSLSNLVFTPLSKVDESIYVIYFQQKQKTKQKRFAQSKKTNFPNINNIMLGGSSPTPHAGNLPFLFTRCFQDIANSSIKEWDLLTVERNGEMLISAEKGAG